MREPAEDRTRDRISITWQLRRCASQRQSTCGQENNPQYRFCGMCGAPLAPAPEPVRNDVSSPGEIRMPVSGPSFLGLGDERSRDLDYLLEDEPTPRGHGRLHSALLLLVVSAGLLAWQWQRDGYPWTRFLIQKPVVSSVPANSAPTPTPDSTMAAGPVIPVEPTANPAPPETQTETPRRTGEAQAPAPQPSIGTASASTPAAVKRAEQAVPNK